MQMKSSKVMGSMSAPGAVQASDKFGSIGATLEREALVAIKDAIHASGGSNAEIKVSTHLKNILEGSMALAASWFDGNRRISASTDLPITNGILAINAKAFLELGAEAKHESPLGQQKTYIVDPAKLRAKRVGSLVVLSHESIPEWGLQVSIEDVKANRADTEVRIAASIQGYCAGQLYRNADLKGGIKMPMVASEAPKSEIDAAEIAEAVHASLKAEQQHLMASSQTVKESQGKATVTASASAQWEASESVKALVRRSASAAALTFFAKQVQGGAPSIKEIDLSGMSFKPSGVEGSAVVLIEHFGRFSRDQMTVAVPFNNACQVIAAAVGRTEADILAAEDIRSKLAIASEQDAKAMFDKFVAEQTALDKSLGINASGDMGYGSNWIKRGPASRIPIEKHALPEEFSIIGKKILIGGMVYEVQPTDYNAPSIEKAAHWMLELRADLPASKADYAYSSSGLGQALSSVGL